MTSAASWRTRTAAVLLTALTVTGLAATSASAAAVPVVTCPSSSCTTLLTGLGEPVDAAYDTDDTDDNAYLTYQNGDLRKVNLVTGARSTVAQGLGNLRGIAVDGAGSAYVGDFDGNLLKVDLATGQHRLLASGLGALHGIVHRGTTTYATGGSGKLYELKEGGTVRVVASGLGLSQGIALDGRGRAYTADMFTGRILQTDLATGTTRTLATQFYEPTSISVAADGQVYFAVGNEVTRLNPDTGVGTAVASIRGLNFLAFKLDRNGNAYTTQVTGTGSLWKISNLVPQS
ncbi:Vgb family protein [Streptomyces sp. NPDC001840]